MICYGISDHICDGISDHIYVMMFDVIWGNIPDDLPVVLQNVCIKRNNRKNNNSAHYIGMYLTYICI